MNEISVKVNEIQTLTSMEVAEMVEKKHTDLKRDIKRYISQLDTSKIAYNEFFKESPYKDSNNRTQKCYMITKKGCEFIAHKLTGVKGTEFTAKYINRFHDIEDKLVSGVEQGITAELETKLLHFMDEQNNFNRTMVQYMESKTENEKQMIEANPFSPSEMNLSGRVKRLDKMLSKIAELRKMNKMRVLHLMYITIEERSGISLDAYKSVYCSETGKTSIGNLYIISQHDWIYKIAVDMCKEVIERYEIFSEQKTREKNGI